MNPRFVASRLDSATRDHAKREAYRDECSEQPLRCDSISASLGHHIKYRYARDRA